MIKDHSDIIKYFIKSSQGCNVIRFVSEYA